MSTFDYSKYLEDTDSDDEKKIITQKDELETSIETLEKKKTELKEEISLLELEKKKSSSVLEELTKKKETIEEDIGKKTKDRHSMKKELRNLALDHKKLLDQTNTLKEKKERENDILEYKEKIKSIDCILNETKGKVIDILENTRKFRKSDEINGPHIEKKKQKIEQVENVSEDHPRKDDEKKETKDTSFKVNFTMKSPRSNKRDLKKSTNPFTYSPVSEVPRVGIVDEKGKKKEKEKEKEEKDDTYEMITVERKKEEESIESKRRKRPSRSHPVTFHSEGKGDFIIGNSKYSYENLNFKTIRHIHEQLSGHNPDQVEKFFELMPNTEMFKEYKKKYSPY